MDKGRIYQYQWFDLALLSVLAAISELMGSGLLSVWSSDFYFSFTIAVSLIAMIRWGAVGAVVGMIGGIPGIMFSDMNVFGGIMFYVLANAFLGIPMLLYGKRNRDDIAESPVFLMLYVLVSHICLSAGKGIVIFFLTGEVTGAVDYFGATFLITVIDLIVCLVLRMRKGLICDMRNYFIQGEGEQNEKYRD
ncbi:hypothetical protein GPL15_26680 [Clostridium sp. MCC353]|uniref:hypothetical protein n=1 Tax=Clostridium sp. MCC353 TaxID=2592646 RepID=UPI001C0315DC|nr:hypothetical protein [Clostridium sp. MCC353]MBT9780057.1 hypothetical protein [Clostridium sp. MCC353]